MYMNHFAVSQERIQHCKSNILQLKLKMKKNPHSSSSFMLSQQEAEMRGLTQRQIFETETSQVGGGLHTLFFQYYS